MPVINDEVRQTYVGVRDQLLRNGYSMKAAMLDAKKRILNYERNQRQNRPLESDSFLSKVFEAMGNSISDGIALSDLENQLNALIVDDISLI